MRMIRKILCTVTAFVLIVCCAGCLPAKNVLTLADSEVTLTVGQRKVLQAVVQPEELEKDLIWSSSNENIATVGKGIVTARAAGETIITVVMPTGEKDKCRVIVEQPSNPNETTDPPASRAGKSAQAATKQPAATNPAAAQTATTPAATQAATQAATNAAASAAAAFNEEAEVAQIRKLYYATQEDPGTSNENSEVLRYVKDGATTKISVPASYNDNMYERWYFFNNNKLYFAFVFKGQEEHRLYFKNDKLIRYIDENNVTQHYGDITCKMENWARNEAYELLKSEI